MTSRLPASRHDEPQPTPSARALGLALCAGLVACVSSGAEEPPPEVDWDYFTNGSVNGTGRPALSDNQDIGVSVPDLLAPSTGAAVQPEPEVDIDAPIFINWYKEYGDQIMVQRHADAETGEVVTYITKPYRLPLGRGAKLVELMKFYGNWNLVVRDVGAEHSQEPPGFDTVEVTNLPGWEVENYGDLRKFPPQPMKGTEIGDRLVVTAEASMLGEVEHFVDLFMAEVPQVEIEAKIIEVIDTDELYFGISPQGNTPIFDFPDGTFIDSFDYSFPSGSPGGAALVSLSGIQDGTKFTAALEAVAANENVEVDSRPKIAVREGGVASIVSTQEIPYYEFSGINSGSSSFSATLGYKTVGIQLYVSPRIVGTETLSLFVEVESSSESGNIVTFVTDDGGSLSTPRITTQVARTTVYLEPGQAVIIAGLTTERTVKTERKVPLLGDIPIIKHLFRSDGTRTVRSHTLFYIKPRILQGIDRTYEF